MKPKKIALFVGIILSPVLMAAVIAPTLYHLLTNKPILTPTADFRGGGDAATPKVDFLSPLENEMIAEINLARTQPQKYASFLEETKKYYAGNLMRAPGQPPITTVEGVAAVDEAIQFLRSTRPLPALSVYKGMSMAAKDHARDLGTSGNTGHRGSDGSTPNIRVGRYGDWLNTIGENIAYQTAAGARDAVMGLIIDDGIANRGHRKNIFDTNYRATGISLGDRSNQGTLCVITFSGGFTERIASGGSGGQTANPAARRY